MDVLLAFENYFKMLFDVSFIYKDKTFKGGDGTVSNLN